MKNNKKTISTIFIGVALAIALAFSACEIDPDVDTSSPSNSLLREQTKYEDSRNSDDTAGATITDFIANWDSLFSGVINVDADSENYLLMTSKPISLDKLKSALKWSTLTTPITGDDIVNPPYEYLTRDSLNGLQPVITQASENIFLINFSNIPTSVSNVIELHVVAANLETAAGGKIDTNNNGIPGQDQDDAYKNITVNNGTGSLSGGSERDPWNTQNITGLIEDDPEPESERDKRVTVTVEPEEGVSDSAFKAVIGDIEVEQSEDGVHWDTFVDMSGATKEQPYKDVTFEFGKFYRVVANNTWYLKTGDIKINGFIQHYYDESSPKEVVLFEPYTIGAHPSGETTTTNGNISVMRHDSSKTVLAIQVENFDKGFVSGADGCPENFRVIDKYDSSSKSVPIISAKVVSVESGTNNIIILTLDPAYTLHENFDCYIGPDVAVKNGNDPDKYFKENSDRPATPNIPAFFVKVLPEDTN